MPAHGVQALAWSSIHGIINAKTRLKPELHALVYFLNNRAKKPLLGALGFFFASSLT
jgi:hypothetical protein